MDWLATRFPQLDALTRAFLTRFFESEITSGTDDLKGSFFWLLSALAIPGIFLPWLRVFDWQIISLVSGPEVLREVSRSDKVFYLGFTMIASGILTSIAWSSLLPDKRDTLILGALPVRPRLVVSAKLCALLLYLAIIAVFIHTAAAVFFGALLSTDMPLTFLLRGVGSHFIAACAAGFTVCFAVSALQGLALTVVGPRLFARVSTALQVALVAMVAICVAYLPAITASVVEGLRDTGTDTWLVLMPPVWFLGLYEWLLGTTDPRLGELARLAATTLLICVTVTLVTFPIAYRRLMISTTEADDAQTSRWAQPLRSGLVAAAGRHPAARAVADFFIASLTRVERQRFIVAIAVGLALAWGLPGWTSRELTSVPAPGLLALPLVAILFLLAGIRVAAAVPSNTEAGWLFEVLDVPRQYARQALERTMMGIGVVPVVLLSAPFYWYWWGGRVALVHSLVLIAVGLATTQMLLWNSRGVPCGQKWSPGRADFGRRWPVHLAAFVLLVAGVPRLEMMLFNHGPGAIFFIADLFVVAFCVRHVSSKHEIVPVFDDVDPVAGVLRLQ